MKYKCHCISQHLGVPHLQYSGLMRSYIKEATVGMVKKRTVRTVKDSRAAVQKEAGHTGLAQPVTAKGRKIFIDTHFLSYIFSIPEGEYYANVGQINWL